VGGESIKGIKLPDTFIRVSNGVKVNASKDEFINFITAPKYEDSKGTTYSEYEYLKRTKAFKLEDEVLDALNLFVGSDDLLSKFKEHKLRSGIIFKRKAKGKIIKGSGRVANVKDEDIKLD
ncbi:hypothetical protein KAU11_11355, partial [Candidatus Babeliales bacterium]|nr:hypothetical protein [Candidatus Babeliales bacterium]